MTIAPPKIGIDISKAWLGIFDASTRWASRITNTPVEIEAFLGSSPEGSCLAVSAAQREDAAPRTG